LSECLPSAADLKTTEAHGCAYQHLSRQQGRLAEQALCGLRLADDLASQLGQELG
jgi:hypothetical protein